MNIDVTKFLEDMTGRYAGLYFAAINDLYVATVGRNKPASLDARTRLGEVIAETMGVAEILGASMVLKDAAKVIVKTGTNLRADTAHLLAFSDTPSQSILPRVTLTEAVDDMIDRTPVTIRSSAERTAQRISQLYGEGRVTAFVMSAEQSVTRAAQAFITRALKEGIPAGEAGKSLAMTANEIRKRSADWSGGYARMAFRTNVNTAVTAGRFRQAQDQDIRAVIPAFRYDAVGDSDTRKNHAAADGIIMSVDNRDWNKIAPPNGYQCRCQVSLVSRPELEAMGRIDKYGDVIEDRVPPGAHPDPGFRHGGRPDLFMVQGAR